MIKKILSLSAVIIAIMINAASSSILRAQPHILDSMLHQMGKYSGVEDTTYTNLLNEIAYQYWQKKLDSALFYAQKAHKTATKQEYQRGIASAWENFGRIAITQGKYDSAIFFHNQALQIYEKIAWKAGRANALTGLGLVYRLQGKYQESLENYNRALDLLHTDSLYTRPNSSEQKILTRILNNIAMVFRLQGRYSEALPFLLQSLALRKQNNDQIGIAGLQRNIGLLFDAQRRFEQAFQWYAEALTTYTVLADKQGIASVRDNIGMTYYQVGNFDSAEVAHKVALQLYEEIGNVQGRSSALYNLANVFMAKGLVNQAEDYHRRALALRESVGDKEAIASSLVGIGQTLVLLKRDYEALRSFERAAALADELGAKSVAEQAYNGLGHQYERLGKQEQALSAYKRLLRLRDTLFTDRNIRALAELQAQHKSEQQEQRIRLLESERHLQKLAMERQEMVRNFALGLGAMALFAATFAFYGYRTKRHSAEILQEQNREILQQQHLLEEQAVDIETANTALQEKNLELEHLNNEKNEFLGIAAHDLKNPLSHIIMASGSIVRYYDRMTDDEIRHQINSIGAVAGRMTEIISNLLDINAIERGGLTLNLTSFDLAPKIHSLLDDYTERATEKRIVLHSEITATSLNIYADEQATTQVLDNIISNAIKYSPIGKNVFVKVKNHRSLVTEDASKDTSNIPTHSQFLRIEIQDEGQGISIEDQAKLFGKFARLSAKPTGGEHSTGLGLSIVKKMVVAMNGRVWCESELGKGATFIVELPQV